MINPEQAAQDARIRSRLGEIKHTVIVMSGKGGVGKSTIATNLAYALAMDGHQVGILDVDIHGPNVPKMLGIEDRTFAGSDEEIEPVAVLPNLRVASIALVGYATDQALIWRGPIKIGLVRQFVGDVAWGALDYLIVDTPPGTGDEPLTLAQIIPNAAGAIIVTTPQDVSVLDSTKSLNFGVRMQLPILGVVENMSGFICPHCGNRTEIFKSGGGADAALTAGVPLLGTVPIEPGIVDAGDGGVPFVAAHPQSAGAAALRTIVTAMQAQIAKNTAAGVYQARSVPPGFKPER